MARGWESKSIEEQQSEATAFAERKVNQPLSRDQIAINHQREGLLLSRHHVQEQLQNARNPLRRNMLEKALADIDERIASLR
jgi:hypothetical protein